MALFIDIKQLLSSGAAVQPGPGVSSNGVLLLPNAEYGIIKATRNPALLQQPGCGRYFSGVTTVESIPRTSGIYQILCIPTGKIYIGSAINLFRRKNEHWNTLSAQTHRNRHLQCAWNKYGQSQFEFVVIELVLSTFLLEREQYWLDKLKTYNSRIGFNIAPTAGSSLGVKRSAAFVAQMRADRTGRKASDETRQKQSLAHKGRKLPRTPEHAAKLSAAKKAYYADPSKRECIHSKQWELQDPEGNVYSTGNLAAFAIDHGLTRRALAGVAMGQRRHHKGWVCRYLSPR